MKKTADPGFDYLKEIGFERIIRKNGIRDRLAEKYGKAKAEQLISQREKIPDGSTEFYEFKNSDPVISKCYSEAYDYDIIRKICNFIDSQKEYFGEKILEVGCESGYVTGFLAKTFPNATIVSIDRSKSAVSIASQRIESMGIKNVEFRVAALDEITEKFDTVVCSRTIQENFDSDSIPFVGEPLLSQFEEYAALTEDYSKKLLRCIKEKGTMCVFERIGHDPLMCGWMIGLCRLNCAPLLKTYKEIKCEEMDAINTFQAFVCQNGYTTNIDSIIDLWSKAMKLDATGKAVLTGWNALLYLAENAGDLIRGVRIYDEENHQVGRFSVYYDKDDAPSVYYLSATGGLENIQLIAFSINIKDDVLIELQNAIDSNERIGFHYEEMN